MTDPGRRAIVYVAWGRRYIEEAIISATTADIAGVDRLLITSPDSRQFLQAKNPFDRIIEYTFKLPGLWAKTEMFEILPLDYNSFLFLDTDTHILMDINQGFEKAEAHGIAAAQAAAYNLEHFHGFGMALNEMGFISRGILQYNTGVIFFTRSLKAWRVLKKWHDLCVSAELVKSPWSDQPYFTLAMELLGFNPYTLSIAYNYRNFGELAHGYIRIWHSHISAPKDVNEIDDLPLWRRFLKGERQTDLG